MGVIIRRPQFRQDIFDIWTFIARDSETEADRFVLELEKRYRTLSENPAIGIRRFPKYPAIRMFPFRRYLIIYEPLADGTGIELVRLLHAARDYHRYFNE
ncbi:toxin ParE1/3/4 [Neorhizobium huautlense]|uniref:Toxin ParE1/3/4 n=1 Tax=Neorhizobium huautlense TaxID=67774 RepID=A0ABT9PR52_9HYPH|nr:type II toxin-antitoxin system RelE/ParE family toxin [Neorhizobium huautlense]MDP9836690.1 toxin ParE1/3/4 [Neorhizobium huautlense]